MKILVLLHEDLVPPLDYVPEHQEWEEAEWKTEYDVIQTLKSLGHSVEVLGVSKDLSPVDEALNAFQPAIVFNLLEEFQGEAIFDQNVVSYLEMKGVPYTGCNPRGLMEARDKALSKKIFKYHKISTPDFFVFPRGRPLRISQKLPYPLFVKTLREEASLGITQNSIVFNASELKDQIEHYHVQHGVDVIAERFVEGREFYVGLMGNRRVQSFPPWELFFEKVSERVPKVATNKVKWDHRYRKKYGIDTGPARQLTAEITRRLDRMSRRVYKALDLSGYARVDLRMDKEGGIYVIEANPNPDIGYQEDLSDAAQAAGINYSQLLSRILHLGLRWRPLK